MYNEHLFNMISREFGLNRAIQFAEELSFMYGEMAKQPNANLEYAYENQWWKTKFENLKHNNYARLDGKVSVVYEGGEELVSKTNN